MLLSYFGDFDCDSTANQFAAQSQRSFRRVSVESQSMTNPLQIRCELISTNVEQKKIFIFMIKQQKLKKGKFRTLIKDITELLKKILILVKAFI